MSEPSFIAIAAWIAFLMCMLSGVVCVAEGQHTRNPVSLSAGVLFYGVALISISAGMMVDPIGMRIIGGLIRDYMLRDR
jgi:uncharacterized membrane protein YccC